MNVDSLDLAQLQFEGSAIERPKLGNDATVRDGKFGVVVPNQLGCAHEHADDADDQPNALVGRRERDDDSEQHHGCAGGEDDGMQLCSIDDVFAGEQILIDVVHFVLGREFVERQQPVDGHE